MCFLKFTNIHFSIKSIDLISSIRISESYTMKFKEQIFYTQEEERGIVSRNDINYSFHDRYRFRTCMNNHHGDKYLESNEIKGIPTDLDKYHLWIACITSRDAKIDDLDENALITLSVTSPFEVTTDISKSVVKNIRETLVRCSRRWTISFLELELHCGSSRVSPTFQIPFKSFKKTDDEKLTETSEFVECFWIYSHFFC